MLRHDVAGRHPSTKQPEVPSPFATKKFMSQRFGFPLCVAGGTRQPAYLALPGTELGRTRSGLDLGPANMPAEGLQSVLCLTNSDFHEGYVAPSGCIQGPQAHLHCPLRPALAKPDTEYSKTIFLRLTTFNPNDELHGSFLI
jgi:hypothetical protein